LPGGVLEGLAPIVGQRQVDRRLPPPRRPPGCLRRVVGQAVEQDGGQEGQERQRQGGLDFQVRVDSLEGRGQGPPRRLVVAADEDQPDGKAAAGRGRQEGERTKDRHKHGHDARPPGPSRPAPRQRGRRPPASC
jgi:hypothetical protein